jgi:hypothetical protein
MDRHNHHSNLAAARLCTLFCAVSGLQSSLVIAVFLSVGCPTGGIVTTVSHVGGWPVATPSGLFMSQLQCSARRSALPVAEPQVPQCQLTVSWAGSHIRPVAAELRECQPLAARHCQ